MLSMRVGWKGHRLTMMQWLKLTKCGLFFYIVSPMVHKLLPSMLQHLDSHGIEALILIPQNCPQYDLTICPILLTSQVFCHVGEQKIVRWCQIRRLWRVINQFKATVMHSSHCNHRLVCRSIVLVKQYCLRQFSIPFWSVLFTDLNYLSSVYLCGRNAFSIRKNWI